MPDPRNTAGNLSLGLGIAALLTTVLLIGGPIGLVGLVLGIIGLTRTHRKEATNLRAAAAGTVLSGIAVLATIGLLAQSAVFVSHHRSEISAYDTCLRRATTSAARTVCAQQLDRSLTSRSR
jgi:hypothetical protein